MVSCLLPLTAAKFSFRPIIIFHIPRILQENYIEYQLFRIKLLSLWLTIRPAGQQQECKGNSPTNILQHSTTIQITIIQRHLTMGGGGQGGSPSLFTSPQLKAHSSKFFYRPNQFNQTWHKVSLGEGNSSLFKWRALPFLGGDNNEILLTTGFALKWQSSCKLNWPSRGLSPR